MAELPDVTTNAISGVNTDISQSKPANGTGNDGKMSRKDIALDSLRQAASEYREKQLDGRRRLWVRRPDKGDPWVPAKSRFKELWISDAQFNGGREAALQHLDKFHDEAMSDEHRAIFDEIHNNVLLRGATVGDIVKLSKLMEHVNNSRDKGAEQYAFEQLLFFAKQTRTMPRGKGLAWSDSNLEITNKSKWCWNRASRKEAGEWMYALFKPLEKIVANAEDIDGGQSMEEFEELMNKLKAGDIETHEIADLFHVVHRAKDPEKYARHVIKDLSQRKGDLLARIVWKGGKEGYQIVDYDDSTGRQRKEGSKRLLSDMSGIQRFFQEKPSLRRDWQYLRWLAKEGKVRYRHVEYLQDILNQHDDPVGYALDQLDHVIWLGGTENGHLGWNPVILEFEESEKTQNPEAATRLKDRLQGLRQLFAPPNKSDPDIKLEFEKSMVIIERGFGAGSDFKAVKKAVDAQLKKLGEQGLEEQSATAKLDVLAVDKNPRTGKPVEQQLAVLESVVKNHNPNQHEQFQLLLGKTGDNTATNEDIQNLKQLVDNARQNQGSQL